jgi:isopentenyl diphosphate isomerase/L-lactate dehydrogenase-like FMN-dependent dehydrogenase
MTDIELMSADELEELARLRLTPAVYDYVAGGAGDERTLAANREGFERLRLRPRILTGVSRVSAEATVLGMPLAAPVFVAPMGGPAHDLVHPDGVRAAAGGAADAGVGYMVSASSVDTLDLPGGAGRVCQVYVVDREATARLIAEAEGLGYGAVCLTADVPVPALRRRNVRHGVARAAPGRGSVHEGGFANHASYARPATWDDVAWLRSLTGLPMLLKGVMTAQDARLAADAGVDGVVVSNHGGRQLDRALGTIEVLPEVVEAVAGRAAVLLDGGVRSSTDVALALALGADAVGIGKAVMWALAAGGRAGVAGFLRSLVTDLVRTLTLLGVGSVAELGRNHVDGRHAPPTQTS